MRTDKTCQMVAILVFVTASTAGLCAASSAGPNKALVRSYFDALNQGNAAAASNLLGSSFVKHNNGMVSDGVGPAVLEQAIETHRRNNAEYAFTVDDMIAEGDRVTVRWTWRSTNTQYGSPRKVTSAGISVFRLEDGRIAELWQAFDVWSFNRQLGFTQTPPPSEGEGSEETLIVKAVEDLYIKGLKTRDFDLIRTVCVPEAKLMGADRDGNLRVTTLDEWSARFDPKDPPFKTLEYSIDKVDRRGTSAQVKVVFTVDSSTVVTDYLHMVKVDTSWRIVNIIDH